MACLNRQLACLIGNGGLALLLAAFQLQAQNVPARLRGNAGQPAPVAPAPAAPAAPAAVQPAVQQPQTTAPASQVAPSMLQQPAQDAQVVFSGDTLTIRADNASLSAILRQVAGKSGTKIDGLAGDERVFGTFGPGAPCDVLADLLNGTAYDLVLLGDLGHGAPRELILTPATAGGVTPPAQPMANEANNEPESAEVPAPPAEVPPPVGPPPPTPGVRTPQQLFEQLQRMRQAQQATTQQDPQQQPPPTQ